MPFGEQNTNLSGTFLGMGSLGFGTYVQIYRYFEIVSHRGCTTDTLPSRVWAFLLVHTVMF